MPEHAVVFVSSDYSLDPSLDLIAAGLRERGHEVIIGPPQVPSQRLHYPEADWPKWFGRADLIVTTSRSVLPRALLQSAPRLRGLVFPTIGTDAIELPDVNELGLVVAHGPVPENFNSMAESAVMLILALLYDLHGSERILRENLPRPDAKKARMLMGKTIGFVGLGRIARGMVERLASWQVSMLAYDPYLPAAAIPSGVRQVDLVTLLREADVVSLHTTLSPETRHMIGHEQLQCMKPSAYLVNTARGGLVDEFALYNALLGRRIAGAALDSFEAEPLPLDSPLRTLDNLILTPHMVGHTQEIIDAIPGAALENIDRMLRGEMPLYCRNPEVGQAWKSRWKQHHG